MARKKSRKGKEKKQTKEEKIEELKKKMIKKKIKPKYAKKLQEKLTNAQTHGQALGNIVLKFADALTKIVEKNQQKKNAEQSYIDYLERIANKMKLRKEKGFRFQYDGKEHFIGIPVPKPKKKEDK